MSSSQASYAFALPFVLEANLSDSPELEGLLAEVFATAEAINGDLDLAPAAFYERILQSVNRHLGSNATTPDKIRFIRQLYASDLYLTTACAEGGEHAWSRFLELYGRYITGRIRAACWNPGIVDELIAGFSADLFLPGSKGTSRISSYDGCCPVRLWLRTVIANRAMNEGSRLRYCANSYEDLSGELVDPAPTALASVEAHRFADEFETCLASAFATLSERERAMVFLRYAKEADLAGISRLYGIHQSTVSRALDRAVAKMRKHVWERFPACADMEEASLDLALDSIETGCMDPVALLGTMCPDIESQEPGLHELCLEKMSDADTN